MGDTIGDAKPKGLAGLRHRLRLLYYGRSPVARRFQASVLLVDLIIIAFFIASPLIRDTRTFIWIDYGVALIVLADLVARALATNEFVRWLRQPTTIVDAIILLTLLLPEYLVNFGFLRILRLWTLSNSGMLWKPFKARNLYSAIEPGKAIVNLVTFLFVATGFVYTVFQGEETGIVSYIDALYFTVTSVTTTGYGDITLPGTLGRLTSIVMMITGITLFVRLAQSIFRPRKVHFPCPTCGLIWHDPDAVHCKACGTVLNIPDEGHH